jgi:hypothetical protein
MHRIGGRALGGGSGTTGVLSGTTGVLSVVAVGPVQHVRESFRRFQSEILT